MALFFVVVDAVVVPVVLHVTFQHAMCLVCDLDLGLDFDDDLKLGESTTTTTTNCKTATSSSSSAAAYLRCRWNSLSAHEDSLFSTKTC